MEPDPQIARRSKYVKRVLYAWFFYAKGKVARIPVPVGTALYQCTNSIAKSDYKNAFSDWIRRLKKYVEVKGDYFEGLN